MDTIIKEIEFCKICGWLLKEGKCPRDYLKSHQKGLAEKRGRYAGKSKTPYTEFYIQN